MLISDAKHAILRKIPDNIDLKDACLYDVVCVGIHAIRLSRFKLGENVVVSGGGGAVGLSVVRLLKAAGARKIAVLQTGPIKVSKIMEFGADLCLDPNDTDDIAGRLRAFFGSSETADVCFECAGTKESLYNCLTYCTRNGGQVMMVGQVTTAADNIVPSDFFTREIDLQPSFVYNGIDIDIYLDMLSSGKISFPGMVTDVIPLSQCLERGLALDREERRKHIRILIDPS